MTLPKPCLWTEDPILEWCTRCDKCKKWRLRAFYHGFHGPHSDATTFGCWWRECMECSFTTITVLYEELCEKEGSQMDNVLALVRELKARTKGTCINPDCQGGYHMCDLEGGCCKGCRDVREALRCLNNLRVDYFETLLEAADLLACSACGDAGCSCLGCRLEQTLAAIGEDAKEKPSHDLPSPLRRLHDCCGCYHLQRISRRHALRAYKSEGV